MSRKELGLELRLERTKKKKNWIIFIKNRCFFLNIEGLFLKFSSNHETK